MLSQFITINEDKVDLEILFAGDFGPMGNVENGFNRNAVYLIGEKMSRKFIRTFRKMKKNTRKSAVCEKGYQSACA